MTNGDHFRAMPDEELAMYMMCVKEICAKYNAEFVCLDKSCNKCCLEWLKQPYEGGEDDGKAD